MRRLRRRSIRVAILIGLSIGATAMSCTKSTASPSSKATRSTTSAVTPTTSPFGVLKPIDGVVIGQCFDQLPEPKQQPYAVLVIPCTELHTYEAFDQKKYTNAGKAVPSGAAYPGDLVVSNDADEQCIAGFKAFIGVDWAASGDGTQAITAANAASTKSDFLICAPRHSTPEWHRPYTRPGSPLLVICTPRAWAATDSSR